MVLAETCRAHVGNVGGDGAVVKNQIRSGSEEADAICVMEERIGGIFASAWARCTRSSCRGNYVCGKPT